MSENLTLGADVEVFASQNQNPLSVEGLIGGSKEYPLEVPGGNLQEDNVMAEFAIDPVSTEEEWINNIQRVYRELQNRINETLIVPSVSFPEDQLQSKQARHFGCDPDFDVWELMMNEIDASVFGNIRTCGGHIHIGCGHKQDDEIIRIIKNMDLFLGVPSVLLDNDSRRRTFYGAGKFRIKDYGLEYRSLSNFWIQTPELMRWVYNQTRRAYDNAQAGFEPPGEIQTIINESDTEAAQSFVRDFDLGVPGVA